jgi:DNA-binding beta-propeller fold protein YncE
MVLLSIHVTSRGQWKLYDTNVLESPRGITTDNKNNIYVVDGGSDNVVVLSPDEQKHKVLFSDRGGIYPAWQ